MSLYTRDFSDWAHCQANLLKTKEYERLDVKNLVQEIEDLAKREKQMLTSYVEKWMLHMLKIKYQPEKHTRSWDLSVKIHLHEAETVLKDNPSLQSSLNEVLKNAYFRAKLEAAYETGLDEDKFPNECIWKPQDIFTELNDKYYKE